MDSQEKNKVPAHVGVIIDGNRRWAKERNLTSLKGHLQGYNKMKLAIDWFFAAGVKILSVFVIYGSGEGDNLCTWTDTD